MIRLLGTDSLSEQISVNLCGYLNIKTDTFYQIVQSKRLSKRCALNIAGVCIFCTHGV